MTGWHPGVAAAKQEQRFLRTDQAARQLHCTPRRVTQLIEEQALFAVRYGRKWLIPETALKEYMASHQQD